MPPKWLREAQVLGNELWGVLVKPRHPWWVAWAMYAAKFMAFIGLITTTFYLAERCRTDSDALGFLIAWAGLGSAIWGAAMMIDTVWHAVQVFGSLRMAQRAAAIGAIWDEPVPFGTEALKQAHIADINAAFNPDACDTPEE